MSGIDDHYMRNFINEITNFIELNNQQFIDQMTDLPQHILQNLRSNPTSNPTSNSRVNLRALSISGRDFLKSNI